MTHETSTVLLEPSPTTPREAGVIQDAHFFGPYKDELLEVFIALDRMDRWNADPRKVREYMLSAWFGGEHLTTKGKDQFTPQQEADARRVLAEAGFTRRITVPYGTVVDDTVVYGASGPRNFDRVEDVRDNRENNGLVTPSVRLMMGPRGRITADGTDEAMLQRAFPDGNIPDGNRWLRGQLSRERRFATETDLGKLSISRLVAGGGSLEAFRIDLPIGAADCAQLPKGVRYVQNGVEKVTPARDIVDEHYVAPDGLAVTLVNAAHDLNRTWGAPRHTTNSCTRELLERYPLPPNGRLLVEVSNPYAVRMGLDVRTELDGAGRQDVEMLLAGAAMGEDMPIYTMLGTLASLTDLDVKRNY